MKFEDIKEDLIIALEEKIKESNTIASNGFTLIDGFAFLNTTNDLKFIDLKYSPKIPIVGIVCNQTGKIHTFALKVVLPNLEF